jgi:DNA-binding CsgD family transcriptional regulator
VQRRFTKRELEIAELWAAGHPFPEIADRMGKRDGKSLHANTVRMTLHRAFVRVSRQFPDAKD